MRPVFAEVLLCLLLCILAGCVSEVTMSGAGGQTTNGRVICHLVDGSGAAAPQTRVTLVPGNYDPVKDGPVPDSLMGTTDSAGNFVFRSIDPGDYAIVAVRSISGSRTIIQGIHVYESQTDTHAADTLRLPGAIKVMLPPGANTANGYLYIPGTLTFAFLKNSSGFVTLDSVPAGKVSDIMYSSTNSTVTTVFRYGVTVLADDTAKVWNPGWGRSGRFILNTSISGADVAGSVTNFPVLIRLTGDNFDFTQARNNGEDIRFAKPDNSMLPYEIKRWDAVKKRAEVWVKVDTVHGNDRTQSITMYWGNANAQPQSNGAGVFDNGSGFQGVWHLGETSGTTAADASQNGLTGIYKGGLPKSENGPLGNCQRILRPDSDYVDMGDVLNIGSRNVSVGAWVKRASFGTQQALISKTNGDAPSSAYGFLFSIDLFNYPHFYMASGGTSFGDDGVFDVASSLTITDSSVWHYLFVSVDRSDNGVCKMYIDGVDKTGTMRGNVTRVLDVANALHFRLGTENDDNYSYKGAIAEVSFAFTARSADWVKLSYMNQKEPDALVQQWQ